MSHKLSESALPRLGQFELPAEGRRRFAHDGYLEPFPGYAPDEMTRMPAVHPRHAHEHELRRDQADDLRAGAQLAGREESVALADHARDAIPAALMVVVGG